MMVVVVLLTDVIFLNDLGQLLAAVSFIKLGCHDQPLLGGTRLASPVVS
jgi:hypothetical protein